MSKIGHIRANNVEDPDNRNSIMCGYVTGDGLLGEVVKAICRLVKVSTLPDYYSDTIEQARLDLYDALKVIEKASSGKS